MLTPAFILLEIQSPFCTWCVSFWCCWGKSHLSRHQVFNPCK